MKDSGFAEMIGLNDFFDGMYFCFADYYAYDEETRQDKKIKAGFEGDWALMQAIAALDEK